MPLPVPFAATSSSATSSAGSPFATKPFATTPSAANPFAAMSSSAASSAVVTTSAASSTYVSEWLKYDFPPDIKEKVRRLWGAEWTGQAQKWFLFRFKGKEDEVSLAGDGKEAAEFSEWKWAPAEDVIKQAVDFKRPVYEQVFQHFVPLLGSKQAIK
ncbi:hypothetical protein CBR_g4841 [Chara braunii]|uniref:Uncharacterized protein n=1 Tax=Chara braunii TaxID=69332 RepID=A0A388KIY4_CHABU|nr:hypothetical protein CBR_g4841 [Chara braunii]|eukprot:GBG70014.1 hypothetical protein CBR_g4841 [Chara braunii]